MTEHDSVILNDSDLYGSQLHQPENHKFGNKKIIS